MQVRFWGTRGSIATPGPATVGYGGNTSCVSLATCSGQFLIIDCGTGARALGMSLREPVHASILLSHTHWDHIQGFPFFAPAFGPGNQLDIYAPEGGLRSLEETLAGQMEYTYFPVDLGQLPSRITYHELFEDVYSIGGVRVASQYLNHPAMTLGYRIEADGVAIAYLSDHEPYWPVLWQQQRPPGLIGSILHRGDRRHARFMAEADLLIHDTQFTPEEMSSKWGWGHSSFDYVVQLAAAAGVRRLALTHHDPARDDDAVRAIEHRARALASALAPALEVFCAREGLELELSSNLAAPKEALPEPEAGMVPKRKIRALFVGADAEVADRVREALGCALAPAESNEPPEIIIIDLESAGADPEQFARTAGTPVLLLTSGDTALMVHAGFDPHSTDYLMKPFSTPQLRARVRARLGRHSAHSLTKPGSA